jgi:pSer/pThr/pTyr-binding forkhead associated (FHA) protein
MNKRMIGVRFMSGPQDGLQLTFEIPDLGDEADWTIGRSDECAICLSYDTQVSRTHAKLVCTNSDETMTDGTLGLVLRFSLVDTGSRNGTYLGEQRLRNEGIELSPGELFRVGRTWLRIDP